MAINLPTDYRSLAAQVQQQMANAPRIQPNLLQWQKPVIKKTPTTLPHLSGGAGDTALSYFMKAMDTLSGVGKGISNQIYTSKYGGDSTWDNMVHGVKDAWDNSGTLGKAALVNPLGLFTAAMYGSGHYGKSYGDIMKKEGVNSGLAKWGGLAGDILLDPTTYLTGGMSAAGKAGARAFAKAAPELAAEYGLKSIPKTSAKLEKALIDSGRLVPDMKNPNYLAFKDKIRAIEDPAKVAMQNKMFAINVPFTNAVKGFGSKKLGGQILRNAVDPLQLRRISPSLTNNLRKATDLTRTFSKIGSDNAKTVHEALESRGIGNHEAVMKHYGVDNFADLTTDQWRHLKETLDMMEGNPQFPSSFMNVTPPVMKTQKDVAKELEDYLSKGRVKTKSPSMTRKYKAFDRDMTKAASIDEWLQPTMKTKGADTAQINQLLKDVKTARGADGAGKTTQHYANRYNDFSDYVSKNFKGRPTKEALEKAWTRFRMKDDPASLAVLMEKAGDKLGQASKLHPTAGQGKLLSDIEKAVGKDLPKGESISLKQRKDLNPNEKYKGADGKLPSADSLIDDLKLPFISPVKSAQKVEKLHGVNNKMSNLGLERNLQGAIKGRDYIEGLGGKSDLGRKLEKIFAPINARTIKSGNALVNEAGNTVTDAMTRIDGNKQFIQHNIETLKKMAKGKLSDEEQKAIAYTLEKAFPKGQSAEDYFKTAGVRKDVVDNIANFLRDEYKRVAKEGKRAGTLDGTLDNYAPHVLKGKTEELDEFFQESAADPTIKKMMNASAKDSHAQARKGFPTIAAAQDALGEMSARLSKIDNPEEYEKLSERMQKLGDLYEMNPIDAYGKRIYKHVVASAFKEMQDNLAKDGLMKVRVKSKTSENGVHIKDVSDMKQLTDSDLKHLGLDHDNKIYYMHPDLLSYMKKTEDIFTDEGMNKTMKNIRAATDVWKALVTLNVPSHYVNNFIGNVAINTMAGVKPSSYYEAMKFMNKIKRGNLTKSEELILEKARNSGVFNGFLSDFIPRKVDGKLEKTAEVLRNWKGAKAMQKVGEKGDDITRLALFLHSYKRSNDFGKAAKDVRTYLFNYNEMTKADRGIKTFVPFWNWTKRNIPLQIKNLASNPKYALTYYKAVNELQGDDKGKLPSFIRNSALPNPLGGFSDYRLPVGDLENVGGDLGSVLRYGLGTIHPAAKSLIELGQNQQLFNGKPIDYNRSETGSYDTASLAKYFANQTGVVGKTVKPMYDEKTSFADMLQNLIFPKRYVPE